MLRRARSAVLEPIRRALARAARERLEVLSIAALGLSRASTQAEVAAVVVGQGCAAMGADTCTLYLLDASGTCLELIGEHGVAPEVLPRVRRIDAKSANPSFTTLETGVPLWVETERDYAEIIPTLASIAVEGKRARAFWSVPLIVEGRPIGLLGMGYHEPRRFPAEERSFVETFSQQCAQALVRALRLERETAARVAAEHIAEATSTLAASLDYKTTLMRLAKILVPRLADWVAIEMIDEETGLSEQVTVAHIDPVKVEHAWELRRLYPQDPHATAGVPNVLRTGVPEIYSHITDEMLVAGAKDEEQLRLNRALQLHSALIVPLTARGSTFGVLTMVQAESGRHYTPADLALAQEIAQRAAISVDNARLFGAERRARAAADDANRVKDEFLATVSHELRTPLNAILGWSRMITSGALDETKRVRANETIERNAVAMTQLIEDLLDISRIISGKMRLEIESVDVAKVVENAIESIRPAAAAKAIVIRSVIEPAPGPILGDPNRLQQVIWNLLSNGVKFTPRGGRVDVMVRRSASTVEISVTDTGVGIDPAFVPFVFDRFRQADGRTTRAHGGLGLGLAITRQLVELHGGSVEANSTGAGNGTRFTVRLPITAVHSHSSDVSTARAKPAVDGSAPEAASSAAKAPSELLGLHVLAVDDDEDARRLISAVLEGAGARVTLASSVAEAMAAFARETPDVVVSDIGMPGDDGVELIRRIRALPPGSGGRVPAAALTAYARAGDRTRVLTAGYLMHLAKPIEPGELLAVVASLARFADSSSRS